MSQKNQDQIDIPVVDISTPNAHVGRELVDAAVRYGFVFIRNQGSEIAPTEIDEAFELRGDYKEAFNFGEFVNGIAQQLLPSVFAVNEAQVSHFADQCHHLCLKLLRLFALGLEVDVHQGGEEWFSSRHEGPSATILRFLYYPATRSSSDFDPSVDVRAGAHSDYGSITLLFQRPGQPGLEVLTPSGSWSSVPVSPAGTESDASPPILINIGDLLSYWTNGLLRSTVHRVMSPAEAGHATGQDRYSIAYFCHPVNEAQLVPVPSERVRERAPVVPDTATGSDELVMTAAEHLRRRLAAAYGWDTAKDK
ncbi:MAG: hypothetical protein M1816_007111 [Peltula sp. TS41687]|nr:MAG: hypothetical protein M1816_007111 [Peltula sp. TS41687]